MRILVLAAVAAFGMVTSACAVRAEPALDPEARYQALLASAKAKAPNVDWLQLRIAYSERPSFRIISRSAARRRMFEASESGDCAAALAAAKTTLDENYVDIDAHMIAAYCEQAAGEAAASQLDRDIGAGLVRSIETGDGLSPAQAFTPIDVDEEYALMRAKGLKVSDQLLVEDGGHSYDSVTGVDDKGQATTYYFIIDRLLALQSAALAPAAAKQGGPPS